MTRVILTTSDLTSLPGTPVSVEGDRATYYVQNADRWVVDLVTGGIHFEDLEVRPVSLEEAFLALTAR